MIMDATKSCLLETHLRTAKRNIIYCFKIQCPFNVTNQYLLMNTNQHHFTVVLSVVLLVCS